MSAARDSALTSGRMRQLPPTPDGLVDLVSYATKGLVDVCESELLEIAPAAVVLDRSERFLIVRVPADAVKNLGSATRTIDDLRLLVAGPAGIGTPADFEQLLATAAETTRSVLEQDGSADTGVDPWSVTVSARNPPWRNRRGCDEAGLVEKHLHGARLPATDREAVDLRLQVDGDSAHVSLNLWSQPVGKHAGELVPNWRGALKPTVAAAVVRLAMAEVAPAVASHGVYDPFCGSGTVVGEALRAGLPVFASDLMPEAVELTRTRLAGFGADPDGLLQRVFVRDVLTGPDSRVTARVVVANLPWGKQVRIPDRGALFDTTALVVWHLVRPDGAAALLTTHEDQLMARLHRRGLATRTRKIGLLGQTPTVITVRPA